MKKQFFAGGFLYNPHTREVLLHKRDNNTNISPNRWSFFGGGSEGEETPIETFIREIKEELGLALKSEEVVVLRDYLNTERGTHRYVFYVISDKKKSDMVLGEGADFDWVLLDKVFKMDLTQKTVDDLTFFLKHFV